MTRAGKILIVERAPKLPDVAPDGRARPDLWRGAERPKQQTGPAVKPRRWFERSPLTMPASRTAEKLKTRK